jgi:hypothetical protein
MAMTGGRSASIFGTMLALLIAAFATVDAGAADGGDKSALAQVRAGYTELKNKRYHNAIKEFSAALAVGKLNRSEMAKALYYRGIAYRKANQATKAITDFSSALWLKGALSNTEREDAEKQRKAAYAEAGGSTAAPVIDSRSAGRSTPSKPGWQVTNPQAKPGQRSAGAWRTSTSPSGKSEPKPQRQASSANPVTSFFSNLFGGTSGARSKSNLTPVSPPQTTASVPRVSAWSSTTEGARATSTGFRTQTQRAKPSARRGAFVIQVAALRSQREVDMLVKRLNTRHRLALGGRQPVVERRSVGNMGALYHVELPGFRSRRSAGPVCKKLRSDGLDCLVQKRKR